MVTAYCAQPDRSPGRPLSAHSGCGRPAHSRNTDSRAAPCPPGSQADQPPRLHDGAPPRSRAGGPTHRPIQADGPGRAAPGAEPSGPGTRPPALRCGQASHTLRDGGERLSEHWGFCVPLTCVRADVTLPHRRPWHASPGFGVRGSGSAALVGAPGSRRTARRSPLTGQGRSPGGAGQGGRLRPNGVIERFQLRLKGLRDGILI